MRNVKFTADMVKEIRRLARNVNLTDSFKAALVKIYQTGYDNGHTDAYNDARQKLQEAVQHANPSPSPSANLDGEQLQPDSGVE